MTQDIDWTPPHTGCEMVSSGMTPIQRQTQDHQVGASLLWRFCDSPLTRAGWLTAIHPDGVSLETAGLRTIHRLTWAEFAQALVKWTPSDLPSREVAQAPTPPPGPATIRPMAPVPRRSGPSVPHSTAQALMDDLTQRLRVSPQARVDFPGEGADDDIF